MCLYGGMNALIPPNDKARFLGKLVALAVGLQFILGIFDFLGMRYFDGAFDILFALIGLCAIRNPDGYSYQQVMCYMFVNGMNFVWSIIRIILYFAGVSGFGSPSTSWRHTFYFITIVAGPVLYLYACIVSYFLYKELKAIFMGEVMNMVGQSMGIPPPQDDRYNRAGPSAASRNWGGGQAVGGEDDPEAGRSYLVSGPRGAAAGGGRAGGAPARGAAGTARQGGAAQSPDANGFKAFSGKGHVLG